MPSIIFIIFTFFHSQVLGVIFYKKIYESGVLGALIGMVKWRKRNGGRAMADWFAIKTEYITTNTSYRKLAEKYGVGYTNIGKRAIAEGWVQQREQYRDKTLTKTVNAISNKQKDRAAKLVSVADTLLDKIKDMITTNADLLSDTQSLKHISGVLKDIKDIQMIRPEADMREQEARIANLRRQAEKDTTEAQTVTVRIEGGDEAWRS